MNKKIIGAALACVFTQGALAEETTVPVPQALAQALEKIRSGQGAQAYDILLPHETAMAGHIEYDYLFGQAAIAANQPSRAAFAFERCLAVDPSQGECRLGMARTHIMLREVASAQREIAQIREHAPPAEVLAVLQNFQDRLAELEGQSTQPKLQAYVQLGMGFDTNFNAAPGDADLAIPAFGNLVFKLAEANQRSDSWFGQAQANLRYSQPLTQNWQLQFEGGVQGTGHDENGDYDTIVADVKAGMSYRQDKHEVGVKLQGQHYQLGGKAYRNMAGVLAQYDYAFGDMSRLAIFAQGSQMTFPDYAQRKAHRYMGGASWSQLLGERTLGYVSAYSGKEYATHVAASDTLDYRFTGFRLGGLSVLTQKTQLEYGGGAERRLYDGREVLFRRSRNDTVYDAYIGTTYKFNRSFSLRTQYRYVRDISSIPLQDFNRSIFTVSVRYEAF